MMEMLGKWIADFDIKASDFSQDQLSERQLSLLFDLNWFKSFLPTQFGGAQYDLWTGLDIIRKASAINASIGWLVNLGGGANFFWHYFHDATAEKIFSAKKTVLAGSGRLGIFNVQDGRYLINGHWLYCSGSAHASHFTVSAQAVSGTIRSFIVEREKVQIIDKWPFDALKSTSSNKISIEDLSLGEDCVFQIGKNKTNLKYPIRMLSFDNFAELSMLMCVFGMYQGLLFQLKSDDSSAYKKLGGDSLEESFGRELDLIKNTCVSIWRDCEGSDELLSYALSDFIKLRVQFIRSSSSDISMALGMDLWRKDSLVYLRWKDLMLGLQHKVLKPA